MAPGARRVLYVATGERHIREVGDSLRSLWRHHPSLPVTMSVDPPSRPHLADWGVPEPADEELLELADHPAPTYSWADKPIALAQDLHDGARTLFLDTDTRVCGDLIAVFDLLDAVDLAGAHAPIRIGPGQPAGLADGAPAAFPELNTGVIAYRGTPAVRALFDRWTALHREWGGSERARLGDQATFRVALYASEARFAVLPPEYNCRFTFPTYVQGRVRILHGRDPDLARVEREVNAFTGPRAYVPGLGLLRSQQPAR